MKLRTGLHGPFSSQFKMLASLNSQHSLACAVGLNAFKPQHNLLCSFSLFMENWLSLPTIATLLPVIVPLSLHIQRTLAFSTATLWDRCLPHFLQEVRWVLGTFTMFARALLAQKVFVDSCVIFTTTLGSDCCYPYFISVESEAFV